MIRPMTANDWPMVSRIYEEGMRTGQATLETQLPSWEHWDKNHVTYGRIVACNLEGQIMGWAALSPVSGRCVYAGVNEVSVYIGESYRRQGVGKRLLTNLIHASEENGIWTLQSGIFPENMASIQLHLNCGFRQVGVREKIGRLSGQWRDVALLERRSRMVGW
jgi:L-amino acid N-acyltransferase YncA